LLRINKYFYAQLNIKNPQLVLSFESKLTIDDLSFDKIVSFTYHFFWNEFCSFYLEVSKKILFGKEGDETIKKIKFLS